MVSGPLVVGSVVKATPSPVSRAYSASRSSTANVAARQALPEQPLLVLPGDRVVGRLQQQLHGVLPRTGRADREPAVLAQRDLLPLLEAEHLGVEPQRLVLVLDVHVVLTATLIMSAPILRRTRVLTP